MRNIFNIIYLISFIIILLTNCSDINKPTSNSSISEDDYTVVVGTIY